MTWTPKFAGDSPDPQVPPAALSVAAMREADRRAIEEFGIPGVVLMENAGRGAADVALEMMKRAANPSAVIVAGRGNNGGDGFVVARHLANAGVTVKTSVLSAFDAITGDARINLDVICKMRLDVRETELPRDARALAEELAAATLIVDAMLGTGTKGTIREPYVSAIDLVNRSGCPVLAVDIPSGLDADTGEPLGACIVAAHTVTFAAPKTGMMNPAAARVLGVLTVVDIGLPRELLR